MHDYKRVKYPWGGYAFEVPCQDCKNILLRRNHELIKNPAPKCQSCSLKKVTQNSNYFSEKSLQSVYWAGFLAGDGNLSCRDKDKEYKVNIGQSEKDKELIYEFKRNIEHTGKVCIRKASTSPNLFYSISFSNRKIYEDLVELYNLTSAKSLNHIPPILNSQDEIKAFIIGLTDSDGSIFTCGGTGRLGYHLRGTELVLVWVKNFLSSTYSIEFPEKCISFNNGQFSFRTTGTKALKVLTDLKQLPIYKLERKWSKV